MKEISMNHRTFLTSRVGTALMAVGLVTATGATGMLAAQTRVAAKTAAKSSGTSDAPSSVKTPWGDPDLQGTWTSDDTWGVPFERPKNFGTRATLTEDELKDRQKRVQQSEEFVDTGSRDGRPNHSPAVAELQAKE